MQNLDDTVIVVVSLLGYGAVLLVVVFLAERLYRIVQRLLRLTVGALYRYYQKHEGCCSFCGQSWRDAGPFCEGLHGTLICGNCAKNCHTMIETEIEMRTPPTQVVDAAPSPPTETSPPSSAEVTAGD